MRNIIGQGERQHKRIYIMQGSKLYVGNLNYAVTEEQLKELFGTYGEVTHVNIIDGRGFGFVEMSDPEEAEQAKEALNDTVFQGRTLRVDEARAPKKRDYGGGGGYGNSRRGGSRGRSRGGYGGSRDRDRGNHRRGY
jgi:RNA recognition motif-containing protein